MRWAMGTAHPRGVVEVDVNEGGFRQMSGDGLGYVS
jgi:hypothetical protein